MVIISESKSSLKESMTLEDVIGLSGFDGYRIQGHNIFIDNERGLRYSGLKLIRGKGSVSFEDISLLWGKEVVLSFPVKNIKSFGVKGLNVLFVLKDGTSIELFR